MIGWLRRLLGWQEDDDPLVGVKRTTGPTVKIPVEDNATEALGLELRVASNHLVDRQLRRRRRIRQLRKVILSLAAALLALIATGRGTQAIGVDVPVVDEVLRTIARDDSNPQRHPSADVELINIYSPDTFPRISPHPNSTSSVFRFPLGSSFSDFTGRMYLDTAGVICLIWTTLNRADYAVEEPRFGKCAESTDILQPFEQHSRYPPVLPEVTLGELAVVISGYAPADVARITAHGPLGEHLVVMSPPWTPAANRIPPFRTFVGIREIGESWHKLSAAQRLRARIATNYDVQAHMDDGRVIDLMR